MNILVKGSAILAANVTEEADQIAAPGVVFPKGVIGAGWEIHDVELPAGFTPDRYEWNGSAVVEKVIPPDPIARMESIVVAVQELLDRIARERGYDNIFTLCTYYDDPDPIFAAEGQAGKAWRSACWAKAREIKGDVIAGIRPLPTVEEVLAEMPAFTWPEV